ncbi:ADP-ribosylglycohydrolase family protein [Arthrobacter rhizosphaerae]|uniref:ADP-ribosylglycohydrolase family protein n=1 Tax=Arthrobacter rhizosphaerae TaxID=2855490 RepID=UPI001FF2F6AC|nr:ADP-ribosylglycohydrolase family protein [Arthrobacter rhizosphaerae]
MSTVPDRLPRPSAASRIHACLLGGALGDSLGYAVEFDSVERIRERFGPDGLQDFNELDGDVHFSDDTQMTLYTVDGLVEVLEWANEGIGADANACLWLAYLRWLATQGVPAPASAPVPQPRWLDTHEVLRHRRAPGNACLSGLSTGEMGTVYRPVNPGSKGCGTVMRSAPFGLIPHIPVDSVYKLSADAASLTHGHPSARQSAGAFSLIIHELVGGQGLQEAVEAALGYLRGQPEPCQELLERLESALHAADMARASPGTGSRSDGSILSPEELVRTLGEGWVAEEALAVAVYSVLATAGVDGDSVDPAAHFKAAVRLAVNHSGDSDSPGSIAGNILGAYYGEACLPAEWLNALEAPEVVRGMAAQLATVTGA